MLQDGEFCRLGGRSPVHVHVRVVAATNVNVTEALAAGKLREDLYYRLSAFSLHLPALRERRADISVLFQFFMNRHAQQLTRTPLPLSAALLEACASYPWPGNVRELENLVRRYLVLGEEDRILQELASGEVSEVHHRARGPEPDGTHGNLKAMVRSVKRKVEMRAIARALEQAQWNSARAARLLKISPKALRYKAAQYGLPWRKCEGIEAQSSAADSMEELAPG